MRQQPSHPLAPKNYFPNVLASVSLSSLCALSPSVTENREHDSRLNQRNSVFSVKGRTPFQTGGRSDLLTFGYVPILKGMEYSMSPVKATIFGKSSGTTEDESICLWRCIFRSSDFPTICLLIDNCWYTRIEHQNIFAGQCPIPE